MTPSQKLRSIADSTGLDGIADAIREIAEEIEHNNAPAVPLGYVNAGHLHEMQSGRLPYAYLYAAPGVGVEIPVYTSNAPAVPQGDPTEEMLVAGLKECEPLGELIDWREGFGRSEMRAVWEAMLGATPAPAPEQEQVVCGLCQGSGVLSPTQKCICQYGGKEPAQEAGLILSAEDVHAAFTKNFPKSRISQAWINFAADIAQAIAARAAKPAQEVGLTDEQKTWAVNQLMEQAQVFASAWSLVGGRHDFGNALEEAEQAKTELRSMVVEALRAKGGK